MAVAPDAGGGSGFQVKPGELKGAGETGKATAELIPGETKGVLGASDTAEAGLKGWTTGAELNSCTDSWRAILDGLAAEMDRQSANLISTAKNYEDTDAHAAGSLANAGGGR
ncbi:type VII secretion target [Kitasatospora sp. NPDC050543]|uniref:type VII secretion target n=1 Tax=Kitasatospora sp. NPDC050543 TaxID=3364054 RepID=UPI0037B746D5